MIHSRCSRLRVPVELNPRDCSAAHRGSDAARRRRRRRAPRPARLGRRAPHGALGPPALRLPAHVRRLHFTNPTCATRTSRTYWYSSPASSHRRKPATRRPAQAATRTQRIAAAGASPTWTLRTTRCTYPAAPLGRAMRPDIDRLLLPNVASWSFEGRLNSEQFALVRLIRASTSRA